MKVTTNKLTAGMKVELYNGRIVRTVDRVVDSGYLNSRNEIIWTVLYQEGQTADWGPGNTAIASSEWEVVNMTTCERCNVGPFFIVDERPYPLLCMDCAELATPSATTVRATYRERREAKAERLRGWAAKREVKASADLERARSMGAMIPFGQPVLVGHYSEGRDRRYRDRIGRTYERAFESARKAESMANRADGIESQLATSIYSDDPNAVEALEARLSVLEAERDRIKAYNASCRKGQPDLSILTDAEQRDILRCIELQGWQCKGGAFPGYKLSNLSGNIKRNRDRLAQLKAAVS